MKLKLKVIGLLAALFMALPAWSAQGDIDRVYGPWKEIFNRPFVAPSADGQYQIKMIGKKFASVFTNTGVPVAVFDLTMNHLTWGKIILGAFLVKDVSLKGVMKRWKCARKARKAARKNDNDKRTKPIDLEKCHVAGKPGKAFKNFWAELKMGDAWATEKGLLTEANAGMGHKFKHGDFDLSQLYLKDPEIQKIVVTPFRMMAKAMWPGQQDWSDDKEVMDLLKEFQFKYDKKKHGYTMVWDTSLRKKKKKAILPGLITAWSNPVAAINHRYKWLRLDQWGDLFKYRWYPYGPLVAMMIYRVSDKLVERIDYHEGQFISLMEEAENFRYDVKLPPRLTELTLDLVYLGRSKPQHFRSGAEYRKGWRAYQEKAKGKVVKKLEKRSEKMGYTLAGGGKFAVTRFKGGESDGEFKGIYAAGIKPHFLTRQLSMHVNAKTPAFKFVERLTVDTAGYLAKAFLRTYWGIRLGKLAITIQLPRDFWEKMVRMRTIREVRMEAQLVSLLDESIEGRYEMPLSKDEARLARRRLAATFQNPYEIALDKEEATIEKNMELLKKAIASPNAKQIFEAKENMIPMSM